MPLMLLRHFFSGLFIATGGQGLPVLFRKDAVLAALHRKQ